MMKVIAIEKGVNIEPAEAIMINEKYPDTAYRWWGGNAYETISIVPDKINMEENRLSPIEINLPENWQEGYLAVISGKVEFRFGTPPKR